MQDGPTLSRCEGDIGTGAVGGRLPLLPLKRPAWSLHWCFHPQDISVGPRRTLEEPVEARRHPLGIVTIVVTVATVVLTGDSSSGSPFAWTWLDAPLTIGGRDSSSSSLSFLSPLRTSAFLRIDTACHDRPRPPLLVASGPNVDRYL